MSRIPGKKIVHDMVARLVNVGKQNFVALSYFLWLSSSMKLCSDCVSVVPIEVFPPTSKTEQQILNEFGFHCEFFFFQSLL